MAKEIINESALNRLYQNVIEDDGEGNETPIKMQATGKFKQALNEFVEKLVVESITHARANQRVILVPNDIPISLGPFPPEPEKVDAEDMEPEITLVE